MHFNYPYERPYVWWILKKYPWSTDIFMFIPFGIFSMLYDYQRPYVYSFCKIFQALCLFPVLHLLLTLEYEKWRNYWITFTSESILHFFQNERYQNGRAQPMGMYCSSWHDHLWSVKKKSHTNKSNIHIMITVMDYHFRVYKIMLIIFQVNIHLLHTPI